LGIESSKKNHVIIDYFKALKLEQRQAWIVAIAADVLQIAAFPLFAEGALSPADSVLDLIVGFVMIRLLGWHWALLPSARPSSSRAQIFFLLGPLRFGSSLATRCRPGSKSLAAGPAPEPRR